MAAKRAAISLGLPLLGQFVPGAPADPLVFGEDPTRDLKAISTFEAVSPTGAYTDAKNSMKP